MKKLLLVFVVFIMTTASVTAQHDVRVNLFGLFFKHYGVGYEYIINDEMGAGIFLNYSNGNPISLLTVNPQEGSSYSLFTATPEFRFYTNPENGADRFYFSGYMRYKSSGWSNLQYYIDNNPTPEIYDLTYSGLAFGFGLGKKWMTNSGLYFETYYGMGKFIVGGESISNPKVDEHAKASGYDNEYSAIASWDFRFHLSIGYRIGGY